MFAEGELIGSCGFVYHQLGPNNLVTWAAFSLVAPCLPQRGGVIVFFLSSSRPLLSLHQPLPPNHRAQPPRTLFKPSLNLSRRLPPPFLVLLIISTKSGYGARPLQCSLCTIDFLWSFTPRAPSHPPLGRAKLSPCLSVLFKICCLIWVQAAFKLSPQKYFHLSFI